jgi:site-specific DNA-methyltransferase (adenine-specific)
MTPYYEHGGIVIYHGDCREVLPTLDVSQVGAVITDPPYGIKACDRSDGGVGSIVSGSKFYGRQKWDHERADDVIASLVEMGKPCVIWGGNYYSLPPATCWLVWDKMQREFTFADAELAWTNFDRAVRVHSCSRGQLTAEGKVHPTQKPLQLMKWCIGLAPKDVASVLDPFAGSGTTLRAAKDLGLQAIGIEANELYCEIAANRLRQEVLF